MSKPISKIEHAANIEPERYEFRESPQHHFELQRRDFFKSVGAGIAILVAVKAPLAAAAIQESGGHHRSHDEEENPEIGAWLHIGEDGNVTVFTGKVEIGQNIRTSLAQAVAEELRVSLDTIQHGHGATPLKFLSTWARSAAAARRKWVCSSAAPPPPRKMCWCKWPRRNGMPTAQHWSRRTEVCAIRHSGHELKLRGINCRTAVHANHPRRRSPDPASQMDRRRKIHRQNRRPRFRDRRASLRFRHAAPGHALRESNQARRVSRHADLRGYQRGESDGRRHLRHRRRFHRRGCAQ